MNYRKSLFPIGNTSMKLNLRDHDDDRHIRVTGDLERYKDGLNNLGGVLTCFGELIFPVSKKEQVEKFVKAVNDGTYISEIDTLRQKLDLLDDKCNRILALLEKDTSKKVKKRRRRLGEN